MTTQPKHSKDIGDDEIRVIRGIRREPQLPTPRRKMPWAVIAAIAVITVLAAAAWAVTMMHGDQSGQAAESGQAASTATMPAKATTREAKPNVAVTAAESNGLTLTVLRPENASPRLEIGDRALDDSTAVLVVQAADVRGDNGKIAGACIVDGELVSRGTPKAGFCAIINDAITIGLATATPLFEQAAEEGGCFFRQYPLVADGEMVENKPKGKSQRKALAELNGSVVVIMTEERCTLHDFSAALAGMGVSNAIGLVGSTSFGHYRSGGRMVEFGKRVRPIMPNTNYLVWR